MGLNNMPYEKIVVKLKNGKETTSKYADYYIQDNILTVCRRERIECSKITYYAFQKHIPMENVEYFYAEKNRYFTGYKAIEALKPKWIPVSEPPKVSGKYLVKIQYSTHKSIEVASFTNNLYEIDEYDFADRKRPGWYGYDSEYGYFEWQRIVAWMKLPEYEED